MRVTWVRQPGGDPDHSSEIKVCRNFGGDECNVFISGVRVMMSLWIGLGS